MCTLTKEKDRNHTLSRWDVNAVWSERSLRSSPEYHYTARHHPMQPELLSVSVGLRSLQTGDYKVVSSSEIRQEHHNVHTTSKSQRKKKNPLWLLWQHGPVKLIENLTTHPSFASHYSQAHSTRQSVWGAFKWLPFQKWVIKKRLKSGSYHI